MMHDPSTVLDNKEKIASFHHILICVYCLFLLFCLYSKESDYVLLLFFMRNWDEKYLLHVYCLLDIVIIFASRGGMSFFFCDVSNYLLYRTGMRKSISNISSDRLSEEQAKKKSKCLILGMFCLLIFFSHVLSLFFSPPLQQWALNIQASSQTTFHVAIETESLLFNSWNFLW